MDVFDKLRANARLYEDARIPLVRGRSAVQSCAAAPSESPVIPEYVAIAPDGSISDLTQGNAPLRTASGAKLVQPLSVLLDDAAAHWAGKCWPMGYTVSATAPDTWLALKFCNVRDGSITVWNGASDDTVFSCAQRNWDFRAWHDWCHLTGNHDFSADGEAAACKMQQTMVRAFADLYGWSDWEAEFACNILDAEINGQRRYKDRHGVDVVRQRDFDMAYIMVPAKALSEAWN